ncbi:5,10-methylenetetrahydrofolate reductase [Dermatophilus congolensis]|uniref:methylenetetrahydrofolate reductase n=1 Tax=Dermatophilus congolensis TaxID=1863 RepID=UPI00312C87E2
MDQPENNISPALTDDVAVRRMLGDATEPEPGRPPRVRPGATATAGPVATMSEVGVARVKETIAHAKGELLFFGITPPRRSTDPEKLPEIAERTLARLDGLALDSLILYDLADESSRTEQERPFPFSETHDPASYQAKYLQAWEGHSIIYRSVGKYTPEQLRSFLHTAPAEVSTVFVGAPSKNTPVKMTLRDAYEVYRHENSPTRLGAVAIPERHARHGDEQDRLVMKQRQGCSFFVTQVVYDRRSAKDMVSDYARALRTEKDLRPAPIIFTLSVCGSLKSLEFLRWLGVDVPRWLSNELEDTDNPLALSAVHAIGAAQELSQYCRHLGIPFGFNVESVSSRKVEIEASVQLAHEVSQLLRR